MASPASSIVFSCPLMAVCTGQLRQVYLPSLMHARNHSNSGTCSVKQPRMKQFRKPSVFKTRVSYSKEDLWAFFPDSVKTFPWEKVAVQSKEKLWAFLPDSVKKFPLDKAENVAAQQLLVFGKQALKWSLIGLFILSSISDIVYSISMNKELVIPFGLFVGCLVNDFLKETSREFLLYSKERDETWYLLGVCCFFVLKIISICFPVGLRTFLCHVANGGILQVLWHNSNLVGQDKNNTEDVSLEDNPLTSSAEDQPLHQS